MATQKHLDIKSRYVIEHSLDEGLSFKAIGRNLDKDCTTISKEVKNHRIFKKIGSYGRSFNNCIHRIKCNIRQLCDICSVKSRRSCKFCKKCTSYCPDYKAQICPNLSKPPYVCNGCHHLRQCTLEKSFYDALEAQKEYEELRSESRTGITISENEAAHLDRIISPLIRKGQSIHHICVTNPDTIMFSEKTLYNYVNYNIFSARNIDLPRKVRYRPRKNKLLVHKVDKTCRIGRTYNDFLAYLKEHSDTPIVQMDSVEGVKGGKVLLTIHFVESELMLAFLRDANDSQSVIDIFEKLYLELSPDTFTMLFPLMLGDNGSEFSNPSAIELDSQGNQRTKIFYCDPSAPYQKGSAENNHEFIRRIIPKGHSLDSFTQEDIELMMNHINSYARKKLGNKCPYEAFAFLYGTEPLEKFGYRIIHPHNIILNPTLLKK